MIRWAVWIAWLILTLAWSYSLFLAIDARATAPAVFFAVSVLAFLFVGWQGRKGR